MLAMRLVRLIEAHSGELCRDLTEQIVGFGRRGPSWTTSECDCLV